MHVEHYIAFHDSQTFCDRVCVKQVLFVFQDFPWIVADEQEVHMQGSRLIPLKTMTSDIVKVCLILALSH